MSLYELLQGDCAQVLAGLPAGSVHCAVTSPPYLGQRDYGMPGQIGLEKSPAEYVDRLVAVFAELWRVLRDDGTLWVNLGDKYNGCGGAGGDYGPGGLKEGQPKYPGLRVAGLKQKDLIGVPWRVAFALQAAGWYLRSEVTWCKLAPMPENVQDRPAQATEKMFLLSKRPRYYYDNVAVEQKAESRRPSWGERKAAGEPMRQGYSQNKEGRVSSYKIKDESATRNLWNYWLVGPDPYDEAHFATYPPALVRPCILAGTSAAGVCPACGAPYVRIEASADFRPGCACEAGDPVPPVVLDPFNGSGTTGEVAVSLGRRYIGIDLNPSYLELAHKRIGAVTIPLFGL